jgi:hypothetical protein
VKQRRRVLEKDVWVSEGRNCRKVFKNPEETGRLRRLSLRWADNIKAKLK